MKCTKYSTEITIQKAELYLRVWGRKTRVHLLVQLLACWPDTKEESFCVSLLKSALLFLTSQATRFISHSKVCCYFSGSWFQDSIQIKGRRYISMSSIVCFHSAEVLFSNWKLNVQSFIPGLGRQKFESDLSGN